MGRSKQRRAWQKAALAGLIAVAVAAVSAAATSPAAPMTPPPNVLYFIIDDLRPEFNLAYNQTVMHTPNLDKLAATGLVFDRAYAQQAVCGPTRNSFMSGRRPHHTLVFDNDKSFRVVGRDARGVPGRNWTTLPQHFKKNGFLTLGGGKTFHPNYPTNWDIPFSWSDDMPYFPFSYYLPPSASPPQTAAAATDSNTAASDVASAPPPDAASTAATAAVADGRRDEVEGNEGPPCGGPGRLPNVTLPSNLDTWCALNVPDDQFYDYTLASNTIQQLRFAANQTTEAGGRRPFFIAAGFARPHLPWRVPKRIWDLYDDADITLPTHPLPPNNMPGVAWYQAGFYNASTGTGIVPGILQPLENDTTKELRRAYYASVSWMDEQVGRVLDELDTLGLADNTIVVFHADHAWQLAEHASWHKFTNFELAVRVPLIMRVPAKAATSAGRHSRVMAELIDTYPTLAELTGTAEEMDFVDGSSLAPVFDDPTLASIPTLPALGNFNKTFAYSQYPHHSDFNCTFVVGGRCAAGPNTTTAAAADGGGMSGPVAVPSRRGRHMHTAIPSAQWMGYTVRNASFRFTAWVPWDAEKVAAHWNDTANQFYELYADALGGADPSQPDGDDDFNAADTDNLAYSPSHAATAARMLAQAHEFFAVLVPPAQPPVDPHTECVGAGGVLDKGKQYCCPKVGCDDTCGGKGCADHPAGKDACCTSEIAAAGKSCSDHTAPCVIA